MVESARAISMLGSFASEPARFRDCLQSHGVTLGALALVCDWLNPKETAEEMALADSTIAMLQEYFPECVLVLCQMPGADRQNLAERQKNALACLNEVGARAQAAGIVSAFHPNSPPGSIFRIEEDYKVLLDGLAGGVVGFAPDAGHIAKGGMDPVEIFREASARIRHVHFKDMTPDGKWIEMGRGCIDFHGLVHVLKKVDYKGWIMVEDESALAEIDPDAATLLNGKYIAENFK